MSENRITRTFIAVASMFASLAYSSETIVIKGSDTLGAKMVPQLAESFKARMVEYGVDVSFEIAAEGSSTGVAAVIDGTAVIGLLSRDLKDTEISQAKTRGVDMKSIAVAKDGVAIIVNEANPIESITTEEIEFIFSGDIVDWSGITAQAGEISVYTRNTSSGTYGLFQELAMCSRDYGPDTQKMAGNEQIAAEVANNLNGIGYVGLAYLGTSGIKVLSVDGKEPEAADYPLARPLFYLVDQASKMSPIANDFIGFSMSPEGQCIVSRVHFIPAY